MTSASLDTRASWLARLAKLNVSRGERGPAPNKPFLVLTLLDLFEAGLVLASGHVRRDAQLMLRFRAYAPIAVARRGNRIDLDMPWKHLASDGLYVPTPDDPAEVRLDEDFARLCTDAAFRANARRTIIERYFPEDEKFALYAATGVDAPSEAMLAAMRAGLESYERMARPGRDARFKVHVIAGYHFTCALTGYRIETARGASILEAAHVHAHAHAGPDSPDNGLALTPTAHRLFDEGLWTVNDDLTIRVANDAFAEELLAASAHFRLADLQGRSLQFHPRAALRPAVEHLRWHRKHAFVG
jgi:putative restriction endonuclease